LLTLPIRWHHVDVANKAKKDLTFIYIYPQNFAKMGDEIKNCLEFYVLLKIYCNYNIYGSRKTLNIKVLITF